MSVPLPLKNRRLLCAAGSLVFLSTLTGCTTPARLLAATDDQVSYWSGRISVQVHGSPPQTTSGSFELSGNHEAGELVLLNPLGNIVARVHWTGGQATMTQGAQSRQASSLDALILDLLGTNLPVSALFDWLQGKATETAGWQADLTNLADGKILARRIAPLPEASLRIVLNDR